MSPPPWHIAVLIPARNEEALLPRCLRSVQQARHLLPAHITTDVIVVADCCTDRTPLIAAEILRENGTTIAASAGNVGAARALAARVAFARYSGPLDTCWLANTDADCIVPQDWLALQLDFAQRGVAAVTGIVEVDSYEEHSPLVQHRFYLSYKLHPDGTHPHVHGANLGVRADAYLQAGGWAAKATAEDHDLWHRLHRAGHLRVSDSSLKVITSGRRIGRAPSGFADALAAHNGPKH